MFSNYNSVIVYLFVYLKHYSSSESPLMCSSCASIIRVSSLVFLLYLFGRMDPQNVPSLFWVDDEKLWPYEYLSWMYQCFCWRRGPAQDVTFFHTGYHLSELKSCTLIFSTNFYFIFVFKQCKTKFSNWIVSFTERIFCNGCLANWRIVL